MKKINHASWLVLLLAAFLFAPVGGTVMAQETDCKPGDPNCPKPKPEEEQERELDEDDC